MRIGIVPTLIPVCGGVHQYSLAVLEALDTLRGEPGADEFVLFPPDIVHWYPNCAAETVAVLCSFIKRGWTVKSLAPEPRKVLNLLRRVVGEGPHREAWRRWRWGPPSQRDPLETHLRRLVSVGPPRGEPGAQTHLDSYPSDPDSPRLRPEMHRWFRACGIELMLYTFNHALAFECGIPFVMPIHGVEHRLFSKVEEHADAEHGSGAGYEYQIRNAIRYATLLVVNSEFVKEDILDHYRPYLDDPGRIKILPYVPACYRDGKVPLQELQRVQMMYHLPEQYLIYPAQFWPSKNQLGLVHALGLLKQGRGLRIPVVFCGDHSIGIRQRYFERVQKRAKQFGVEDQIYYLGQVPYRDMPALYARALALIMPTFFPSPTQPPLEAWACGTSVVIAENRRGLREQVGDAAVLVDPYSAESIAAGIAQVWTDSALRHRLRIVGRERLAGHTLAAFRKGLQAILDEAKDRLRRGDTPKRVPPIKET
jgi:glycosyltransferase involved in cell wall biosynthesis